MPELRFPNPPLADDVVRAAAVVLGRRRAGAPGDAGSADPEVRLRAGRRDAGRRPAVPRDLASSRVDAVDELLGHSHLEPAIRALVESTPHADRHSSGTSGALPLRGAGSSEAGEAHK